MATGILCRAFYHPRAVEKPERQKFLSLVGKFLLLLYRWGPEKEALDIYSVGQGDFSGMAGHAVPWAQHLVSCCLVLQLGKEGQSKLIPQAEITLTLSRELS